MDDKNNNKNVDGIRKLSGENLVKSRKIVLDTIGEEIREKPVEKSISVKTDNDRIVRQIAEKEKSGQAKPERSRQDLVDGKIKEKLASSKDKIFNELGIGKIFNEQAATGNFTAAGNKENEPLKKEAGKAKPAADKFFSVSSGPPRIFKKDNSVLNQKPSGTLPPKTGSNNYAPDFKNIRSLAGNLPAGEKEINRIIKTGFGILGTSGKKPLVRTKGNALAEINGLEKHRWPFLAKLLAKKAAGSDDRKKEVKEKKIKSDFFSKKSLADSVIFFKKCSADYLRLFFNGFFIFISLYIVFVFMVTGFRLDNRLIRIINNYLPVPAIIYNKGVINYFWYVDFTRKNLADSAPDDLSAEALNNHIFKDIIFWKLAKKYNISPNNYLDRDEFTSAVSSLMASDLAINQVSINRINKIREMIKTSDDFSAISEKYGDEQGEKNFDQAKLNELSYKSMIENLNVGDISQVIIQPEGYYIFYCRFKNQHNMSLRYIFIKSIAWEEYINNEVKNFKYISLVD